MAKVLGLKSPSVPWYVNPTAAFRSPAGSGMMVPLKSSEAFLYEELSMLTTVAANELRTAACPGAKALKISNGVQLPIFPLPLATGVPQVGIAPGEPAATGTPTALPQ